MFMKQALHNLSLSENLNTSLTYHNRQYYKGLFIMAISCFMEKGYDFNGALREVYNLLPYDHIDLTDIGLPENWNSDIEILLARKEA